MPLHRFIILLASVILAAGLTLAVAASFGVTSAGVIAGLSLPALICAAVLVWISRRRAN